MSHKMKMSFRLKPSLFLTNQLKQSIQILTFSHQELKAKIEEELLSNPVLESVESEEAPSSSLTKRFLDAEMTSLRNLSLEKKPAYSIENLVSKESTLKNHLLWQVQISPVSDKEKSLLAVLVDHLDDRGYLILSLEELSQKENLPLSSLKEQLSALQEMDPLGVGARSLQECLLIQARYLEEDTKDMVNLIQNHLPLLETKNYKQIASLLKIEEEEVKEMHQILASMEPHPARNFSHSPTVYITPDVYIYKENEDYKVALQEEGLPRLQIGASYKQWLENYSHNREVKRYIKEKFWNGSGLIRALIQRQETIRKVCYQIIHKQKEFFDKGPQFLKPLALRDIALELNLHCSTVSRVTSRKYAHTQYGLVPLRYFFKSGLRNDYGELVCVDEIKQKIKSIIKKEDASKPLSDQEVSVLIHEVFHIFLSRRTVAQYRQSLGIPSIKKRKKTA